jgi:hypothetical protein
MGPVTPDRWIARSAVEREMPQNMGFADRTVRLVIGAAALLVGGLGTGFVTPAGIALLVVAAIMLLTSAAGFCPLYVPLRLSTGRRGVARV